MSSAQYAEMNAVAYNPSSEDLDMAFNSILNAAAFQSEEINTGTVNVGTQLNLKNDPDNFVSLTALGLSGNQSYNFPVLGGTDGQVLTLTGNSGQLIWATPADTSGAVLGVSSLNGVNEAVTCAGENGTIVVDVSGRTIDFRVAVPVVAGTVDGDYPTWDTVLGKYGVGTAPVTSLNGLNGILGIQGGEAINVDTSGVYITISTALPSGLATPQSSDATALSFAITGVSPNVTANSVVHATVQYPDNIASPQDAWLVYASPSDASGGSITFFVSSGISMSSTLKIAWMVDKF